MKKYLIVFSNTLQKALIYRARNVIYAFIGATQILVMISIWSKYYAGGQTVPGFTFKQLLAYYFATLIIDIWISKVHENVKDDIKDGELSNYVIKPFNYFGFRLSWELGWYVVKFILLLIPLIWFFSTQNLGFVIRLTPLSILSLIMAYLLSFCASMIIGLVAFHTTETTGLTNLYRVLLELLTGKIFPLTFFSPTIQAVLDLLPFKYMIFFPARVLTGQAGSTEVISGLVLQATWLIALYLLSKKMWQLGINRFSGIGL